MLNNLPKELYCNCIYILLYLLVLLFNVQIHNELVCATEDGARVGNTPAIRNAGALGDDRGNGAEALTVEVKPSP